MKKIYKKEKLTENKKQFDNNIQLISDLQHIFTFRLQMEQEYLQQFNKLAKLVDTFSQNYNMF